MTPNFLILALAAIVPMVMGFIWYHPKVMGTVWMEASGLTEEKLKGANMPLIFLLSYLFSFFIFVTTFMAKYGSNFRTFKHGVFHGVLAGIFFALPVLATNALFERKGFKYIAVNAGYWIITIALMGGIICQFA